MLVNYDAIPSSRLTATPSSVCDDDGPTEITVPAALDLALVADFSLTIDGGSSTGSPTFTFTSQNDTENEFDEFITIAGTSPLTTNHATFTLIDYDADRVVLFVSPETVHEDRRPNRFSNRYTRGQLGFLNRPNSCAIHRPEWQPLYSKL